MSTVTRLLTLATATYVLAGCSMPLDLTAPTCGPDFATGIDTCTHQTPVPNQPAQPPTPPPQDVRVTPEVGSAAVGDTIQVIAIPYDSLGRVFVEPSQVVWASSDSSVARIVSRPDHYDMKSGNSTSIKLVGVASGTATITATVIVNNGGLRTSGEANVTVH